MSKTKKQKVKKLTQTDYNNYIMALKDEVPPKAIEEYQKGEKEKL